MKGESHMSENKSNKVPSLLKLKNVSKFYYNKGIVASGFTRVSLEFNLGEFVVITGESGSGKSTLLNVLSGLDSYEEGEMYINGKETSHYSENDFEHYRKTYIGNIFQSFNLVGSYTVYQNIELVLLLNGFKKKNIKKKVLELIRKVDLYRYRNTRVSHLSGGQKQRVAIARALAKDTPIIIADEPTGNLDIKSAKSVLKLLAEIAKEKLVIVVTHNYEQVESYATRKIEMHDGKVREDIILKEHEVYEPVLNEFKDIRLFSKIKIGIRNTFNIIPKFVLMFAVFLFVIVAFLGEYSSFKEMEYEESKDSYNYFFTNYKDTRMVIKKKDGSFITDDEFLKIEKIANVEKIEKDDTLLDTMYLLNNDYYYFNGTVENASGLKDVDAGRLPQSDNEIVIEGAEYDYYLSNPDDLIGQELSFYTSNNAPILDDNQKVTVVGIKYSDSYDNIFYTSGSIINKIRVITNQNYSTLEVKLNNNIFKPEVYENNMNIMPNKKVPKGEAYIAESANNYCLYDYCLNSNIDIKISNIYYEEALNLKITGLYNSYNFNYLTGLKLFDENNGRIFISYEDYNELYNKHSYQSSVFAGDVRNVDDIASKLDSLGFKVLKIKDTASESMASMLAVLKIFRLIVTVVLFIVLFFISYFVIRLIQKSKNIYYATVRILGGSKKVIKSLIRIELFTVFNLTYFIIIALAILVKQNYITFDYINNLTSYLDIKDYILIYIILFIMSFLISARYSRKLFKSSAMKAYREEV